MALREQWGLESLGDHSSPLSGYLEFLSFSSCPCKLKITKTTILEDSAGAVVTSQPGCCMPLNPRDTWWYWQNLHTNWRPQNKVAMSFRIILFKEMGDIPPTMTREQWGVPPRHVHGDLTSVAPYCGVRINLEAIFFFPFLSCYSTEGCWGLLHKVPYSKWTIFIHSFRREEIVVITWLQEFVVFAPIDTVKLWHQ